jgi:hypothetical protein
LRSRRADCNQQEKPQVKWLRRSTSAAFTKDLTREKNPNLGEDPSEVVREFRTHWCDTKLFSDPFVGLKFAQFLFRAHDEGLNVASKESVHHAIEEAQLFVEAAHQAHARMGAPSA